jgi:hypothetical protein
MVEKQKIQEWQEEIRAIGATNPLRNFEINTFGQIDLERSHPGGYSQFITGGQTLLSNLVRDPLAFSRALSAARRIKAKSQSISQQFGIETLHLIGGLANFEGDGFDLNIPILMWPVSIIRKTDDYELSLDGPPRVNPTLISSLEECYGIKLNPAELLARQNESSDLVPVTVLNYLANLAGSTANLDLSRVLVILNCTSAVEEMLADFQTPLNSLVAQLTGEPGQGLEDIEIPQLTPVVDADATQTRIIARAKAGASFAVETLPGCGYIQTVVNVISTLVQDGKRVLVVAPRKQTLNELADRFSSIGLAGLATRSDSTWIDVVSAISRNEKASPSTLEPQRLKRVTAEAQLDSYFEALNSTDPVLGVSVARILRELSKLSAISKPALTNARIPQEMLLMHTDRSAGLALLQQAHDLGEFRYGPQDSAWYQAVFQTQAELEKVLVIAKGLHEQSFPSLSQSLSAFTARVNFKPAESVQDWEKYLALLIGVRDTLDRFVPDVFERALTELIAATAPRKGEKRNQMSGSNRRRLKKLAREYLRPGMHVGDMHSALIAIQNQRELWQSFSSGLNSPQVPQGINEAFSEFQKFQADLDLVQAHLDSESTKLPLAAMPLNDLSQALRSLAVDTQALENYQARAEVFTKVRELGLAALARDLGRLHAAKDQIAMEFDQAWWQSALESVVSRNAAILGFTPEQISNLEHAFRAASAAEISAGASVLAAQNSQQWKQSLVVNPIQAQALKELLKTRSASFPLLAEAAPDILPVIAPVVLLAPLEVPKLLAAGPQFDCVLVLDAAGITVAEGVPALKRANQLIAFGDEAIAAPVGFDIEPRPIPAISQEQKLSIYSKVTEVFGVETLRRSYRSTGTALGQFINREFYQDRIQFLPTAPEYLGVRAFNLEVLTQNNRAATTIEGATESLDAELNLVLDQIISHATNNPELSLLVVSASSVHAERIRSAVASRLQARSDLAVFFDGHGSERFEVVAIAELAHRIADRVIFSLGFGKTSHGSVPSGFGQLSQEHGKRYLANLLVSARKQITMISCIEPEEVPADRLENGALLLREMMLAAKIEAKPVVKEADPMLSDLSIRLRKLGARVDDTFSKDLPLVVSFGNKTAVIEPDWFIPGQNRVEKFCIRPGLLTAMGWLYIRVYSFELFSDPQAVANRIAEQLGMQVTKRPLPLFETNEQAFEDSNLAWGDSADSNDSRLRQDKPPHWG